MRSAQRFREHAASLRRLASRYWDPDRRLQLYVLASDCDEIAEDIEWESVLEEAPQTLFTPTP